MREREVLTQPFIALGKEETKRRTSFSFLSRVGEFGSGALTDVGLCLRGISQCVNSFNEL